MMAHAWHLYWAWALSKWCGLNASLWVVVLGTILSVVAGIVIASLDDDPREGGTVAVSGIITSLLMMVVWPFILPIAVMVVGAFILAAIVVKIAGRRS